MRGAYQWCRRGAPAALALASILAAGCENRLPTAGGEQNPVPLRVTASVVGTPIATVVVQVTAADIAIPLVFNLTVINGTAAGTILVPAGPARTIAVTAMDAEGDTTDVGSVTLDVRPSQNPPLVIHLVPVPGQLPITVTFGNYGVVVTPAAPSIAVGAQVQLTVAVTDAYGVAVANPAVGWATSQPTVATVSASGLVSGLAAGMATIVATYEGVAALSTVTVTGGTGGFVFASLSAGGFHTCGLTPTGAAYCWGNNPSGELGDGTTTNRLTPVAVAAGLTFASLSAGLHYTCGLTWSGMAYCWGDNSFGQLGDGTTTQRLTPVAVASGLSTFANLSTGYASYTCGLTPTGVGYCWGDNTIGELGDGTTTSSLTPVAVAGGLTFANLSAATHTCGLTSTGVAACWGSNGYGELGDGTTTQRLTPVAVASGLSTFASLSTGYEYSCGLTPTGVAYCWGYNASGQLGDGTTSNRLTPAAVNGGLTFTTVTTSKSISHTCGVTPTGAAYCWGWNGYGELGDGTMTQRLSPVIVAGGLNFASLSAGALHTCGLTRTGVAYCWGDNSYGELGTGTTTSSLTPVAVVTPTP